VSAKRRLPLVPSAEDDGDPKRSAWQWVAFGTLAIFVLWLPVSALALSIAMRFAGEGRPGGVPPLSASTALLGASSIGLAFAAFGGGFTIGRWGAQGVGVREAVLAGLVAAVVAIAASWLSYGIALGAIFVVVIAVPLAGLGGKLGISRRRR
jgi:bacteriorhodopsin